MTSVNNPNTKSKSSVNPENPALPEVVEIPTSTEAAFCSNN